MAEDVSILSEIDEALRADTLQQLWERHARSFIVFCVMAVLASAGSVLWKNHLHDLHERETTLLAKAAAAEQEGKNDAAIGYYAEVEKEGGALAALAGIRHAALLIDTKQPDKAQALYASVADGTLGDGPEILRDFAGLEAAILESNRHLAEGKTKTPVVISGNNGVFHDSATEIGALNAIAAGDTKTAALILSGLLADNSAPYSQRERASEILDSIKEHTK